MANLTSEASTIKTTTEYPRCAAVPAALVMRRSCVHGLPEATARNLIGVLRPVYPRFRLLDVTWFTIVGRLLAIAAGPGSVEDLCVTPRRPAPNRKGATHGRSPSSATPP